MDHWYDHFTDEEQELLRSGTRRLAADLELRGDTETASAAKDLLRKLDGAEAVAS